MKESIGLLYDREKFLAAVKRAALAFSSETMGEYYANQPNGIAAREILEGNALAILNELPIEYYQMIEAYVDGKPAEDYAEFVGGKGEYAYFRDLKTQGMGLLDLLADCKDGRWKVKDKEQARAYYEKLFPLEVEEKISKEYEAMECAGFENAPAQRTRVSLTELGIVKDEEPAKTCVKREETSCKKKDVKDLESL